MPVQEIVDGDMMRYPVLETARVVLRELALSDAEALCRHFSDPDVVRFMDIEPCTTLQEAEEIIRFHLQDRGCRWGLFSKKDGALIGTCGYHGWPGERNARAELDFDLARPFWGQGLMREALVPVIRFGFGSMVLSIIEAKVDPANERSQKLLRRMGFTQQLGLVDDLLHFYLERSVALIGH